MVNAIVQTLRESRSITQAHLAEQLGIDRSAIAHFESGELSALSIDTLLKMAPFLDINTDYIQNKDPNPFRCYDKSGLIKLPLKGKNMSADLGPIDIVIKYGFIHELIFLTSSHLSVAKRFKKIITGKTAVYSMILKDIDDDIFLSCHKDPDCFIGYLEDLRFLIQKRTTELPKEIVIKNETLSDALFDKIHSGLVTGDEIIMQFDYVYSLKCPRLVVVEPDGRTIYLPKVPMYTIRRDLERYLKYSKMEDPVILKSTLKEMVRIGLKAEKKTMPIDKGITEYKARLEAAYKAWKVPYTEEDLATGFE